MERNIRLLKIIYGLIGFLPASAIWILYFAQVTGSVAEGGFLLAVGMMVAAVLDIPTGVFSDRVGRKAGAIVGTVALALCVIVYACAFNWWTLLIATVLDGIGMAMLSGNNAALLHESLSAVGRGDEFGRQYGKMQGSMHWMGVLAALAGAGLATISLRWAVIASIPSYVMAAILTWSLQEPARTSLRTPGVSWSKGGLDHVKVAVATVAANRRLTILAFASMLAGGIGMAAFMVRPTWTQTLWPIWAVGVMRAGSALLAAVGTWWGGALVARIGALKSIVVTQLASSGLDIVALMAATVFSPAVLTSSSLAFGVGATADGVVLQREFTDDQRATLGSLVAVGTRCIYAFAVVGFGFLAGAGYMAAALIAAEVLMIVSVAMYAGALKAPARLSFVNRSEYVSG